MTVVLLHKGMHVIISMSIYDLPYENETNVHMVDSATPNL